MQRWLFAFIFTQLVEIPIYRRYFGATTLQAFGASAITHPMVWFGFIRFGRTLGISWTTRAIAAELFAWLVEALYFAIVLRPRPGARRALVGTLLANGISVLLGFLSYRLFGG